MHICMLISELYDAVRKISGGKNRTTINFRKKKLCYESEQWGECKLYNLLTEEPFSNGVAQSQTCIRIQGNSQQ